jgi:2-oxoisovalerate dehydrogenase E1 component
MKMAINHKIIKQALTIRRVEEKFLDLFSQGKLNGTVHTCVGQEFSAMAFAAQLEKRDFIFSNHRCHGHYMAFTDDVRGLLAELLGKSSGTSGGIGSSQHLCRSNFYSNGIQGGIVPVAAGYALGNKLNKNGAIGVVFIGDGTLGEGALYETMNIISKWEIPLLIVCENNFYAQSTPQSVNLAGSITARAEAFSIKAYKGDTWNPELLLSQAQEAMDYVRTETKPAFFHCDTYRLNAHSKGDDDRSAEEINEYKAKDFLVKFEQEEPEYFNRFKEKIDEDIDRMLATIFEEGDTKLEDYYTPHTNQKTEDWIALETINKRQVELMNTFFKQQFEQSDKVIFIGEDCLSPYGGAFKVAKDLSIMKPNQLYSTPISESAIMGISNGLALNGFKPFAEIMFGDFITLAFDQIINHASKFHHMFNKQIDCPVVVRTPMGGRRGYGPTHSQTLDKFLIGIDHVKTVAINTFFNPAIIFESILQEKQPVIVLENKTDYGKKILTNPSKAFVYRRSNDAYPIVHIKPIVSEPDVTIVAYGGMADYVSTMIEDLFKECDIKPELIIPSLISEIPVEFIAKQLSLTKKLIVIEEGSSYSSYSSELIASLSEIMNESFKVRRIAGLPVPIPSVKSLEDQVLPSKDRIINEIKSTFN